MAASQRQFSGGHRSKLPEVNNSRVAEVTSKPEFTEHMIEGWYEHAKEEHLEKNLAAIMIVNIALALIDKVILLLHGAWGAPVIITAVLWFFVFKDRKWAFWGFISSQEALRF